jgi:hypothetical protein
MVTSGFSGTVTGDAGAYNTSLISSVVLTAPQAICGTGVQGHVGTFRVKARVNSGSGGCDAYWRFAWRVGDGSYTTNDPARLTSTILQYYELDLGLIAVPEALLGTQAWDGRIEAYSADGLTTTLYVDYLLLFPVEAGYGKATASYAYTPGVISARDSFAGLGSGAALHARTPDAGTAWATSGVATDFVGSITTETTTTQPRVQRSTASIETEARAGVLGSAMTNQEVQATSYSSAFAALVSMGVIARYVDDDNYLWLRVRKTSASRPYLEMVKKIAGVETTIGSTQLPNKYSTQPHYFNLVVFASGRAIGSVSVGLSSGGVVSGGGEGTVDVVDTVLATAGTLASGKGGIADQALSVTASTRKYDDVSVLTPAAEPIALYSGQSLEVRHDDTVRESSAGGTWGRPQAYRGSRFKVQPAGTEDRTTRVAVKATRNDITSAPDLNFTDQILLEAIITPRCSVVPRS